MNEDIIWIDITLTKLSEEVSKLGIECSPYICKQLLDEKGFGLRKMSKEVTLKNSENRDEQFKNINTLMEEYKKQNNPIISVDTKKKETIGTFYRDGRCYCNEALKVYDHDFKSFGDGTITPHGIYDVQKNIGYMTLSESKDTSEFACDCIENWWENYGKENYSNATSILVLCDGGGSNSSRSLLFKADLQILANKIGIEIRIAHYPPYTSKHNPIEHRLFPHVTRAISGVLINSIDTMATKIKGTTTSKGLKVFVSICKTIYETGRKVALDFVENCSVIYDSFLGKWNYKVVPQNR